MGDAPPKVWLCQLAISVEALYPDGFETLLKEAVEEVLTQHRIEHLATFSGFGHTLDEIYVEEIGQPHKVWQCKLIVPAYTKAPVGFDWYLRNAVDELLDQLEIETLLMPSGWGASLNPEEIKVFKAMQGLEQERSRTYYHLNPLEGFALLCVTLGVYGFMWPLTTLEMEEATGTVLLIGVFFIPIFITKAYLHMRQLARNSRSTS